MTVPPPRLELSGSWAYRGEGNANLVISIPEARSVYRFAKSKYDDKDHDSNNCEIADFSNMVMRPLLGSEFVRPVSLGVLLESDFEEVRNTIPPFRPFKRMNKDIKSRTVIVCHDATWLTPDYESNDTFGDVISIEIKPKQGWFQDNSSGLCPRCLKKAVKSNLGDVSSDYCPLDLFSGHPERMKRALLDLYEKPESTRFKAFKNGQAVPSETFEKELRDFIGGDVRNGIICLLMATFLGVSSASAFSTTTPAPKKSSKNCQEEKYCLLPENSVLKKILNLQKGARLSDYEALILCEKLLLHTDSLETLNDLVLWRSSPSDPDLWELRKFLISVTAKDVSVFLTFRKSVSTTGDIDWNGQKYRAMISVIDLDPKPVHRIARLVQLKKEWLQLYSESH